MPDSKIIIGIQGDRGSTNEQACRKFIEKYHWEQPRIRYLISTEQVLAELAAGYIDYGTFALKTSRGGWVEESRAAMKKYTFRKVDEIEIGIDHVLLAAARIDIGQPVHIISHPQALKVHRPFLSEAFPESVLMAEEDTALAAKNLKTGEYPPNSLVIAPVGCAALYGLKIFRQELPTNSGYTATIYLVRKS